MNELQTTNRLLGGILILMALATMYFAKDIVLPVLLGFMLALTLGPIVRVLSRIGIPPAVSAVTIILALCALIAMCVYLFSGTVTTWFDEIPGIAREIDARMRGILDSVAAVKEASEQVEDMADAAGEDEELQEVVIKQPGLLNSAVGTFASFSTSLALGLILAVFLLGSGGLYHSRGDRPVEAGNIGSRRGRDIVLDIERSMSHYLIAITVINAALGLSVGVAMYFVGMPYPIAWGVAAFFLNFLPYLGGLIGTIGVAAFSVVTFESFPYALLAPVLYQALTAIEAQFVTPVLLGMRLQLNTVVVFLMVIFWSWLWGIPGALIAVPILVMIKVISDHVAELDWLSRLLAGESPVVEDEDAVV